MRLKQVERSVLLGGPLLLVSTIVLLIQASSAPRSAAADLAVASGVARSTGSAQTIGLNSHPNTNGGPRAARLLGARLSRVEWGIGESPREMERIVGAYARVGVRIQPLAGFAGRLPSSSEAQNLRSWALRFGPKGSFWRTRESRRFAITQIEFGNETSYGYQYGDDATADSYVKRAREYGARAREAALALKGTGVGLLVQADDGGSKRSTWVDEMLSASPDLPSKTAGWIVHPYGPSGAERIRRMILFLGANGVPVSSIRIYVTEWGIASGDGKRLDDNYGFPLDMTYKQASEILRDTVAEWRRLFRTALAQVIIYQDYETHQGGESSDREHYFGALRPNGGDKGAYTAEVRWQLAGQADR